MKRWLPALLVMVVAVAGCPARRESPQPVVVPAAEPALKGGTDVTFFVTGDSHFGVPGMEAANRRLVEAMNRLPGTPYPGPIGGRVALPRGVIHCGDATDLGLAGQWSQFEKVYGLTATDGVLRFPVFEATGNHDRANIFSGTVARAVGRRHGGLSYSWNWDDVHLVCLDVHPTAASVAWLKGDLAGAGRRAPVVIFFHYTLMRGLSDMWSAREKDAFAQAIAGYNVVAIFTGHWHVPGHDVWRGYDVFRPGAPRHNFDTFIVVRITDERLALAFYDWGLGETSASYVLPRWRDVFVKSIDRAGSAAAPAASHAAARSGELHGDI